MRTVLFISIAVVGSAALAYVIYAATEKNKSSIEDELSKKFKTVTPTF